jgi:acetyl esterase/lipase
MENFCVKGQWLLLFFIIVLASSCTACKYNPPICPSVVNHDLHIYPIVTESMYSAAIYKTTDDGELIAHIFAPKDRPKDSGKKLPAILFFHGGGWVNPGPDGLFRQCEYFAARGWMAISIQYRLCTPQITPIAAMMDAKSAVRWARKNSSSLGIDPSRIIVAGASAGGHLAAVTATIIEFNETSDDLTISAIPDGLVLYYPCVNTVDAMWFQQLLQNTVEVERTSPAHHVRENLPPTVVFHGTSDATIPHWKICDFCQAMINYGNRCDLYSYEGRGHLLFATDYQDIMEKTEDFLISLGYEVE